MPSATIHQIGLDSCLLCAAPIPPGHCALSGEYVGVIHYRTIPPNSYRMGEGNRDALCNGTPWTKFNQRSRKP